MKKQISSISEVMSDTDVAKYICTITNTHDKLVVKYKFKGRFYYYHHITHGDTGIVYWTYD